MKRIRYNVDFLPELIRRVTAHGRGTKTQIVDAMNIPSETKKATLTSLDRWISGEKPLPVNRLVNLVNNMEDVTLGDFFVYEDGEGVQLPAAEGRRAPVSEKELSDMRLEMMQMKIDHLQELERVRNEYRQREDALRQQYEERLAQQQQVLQKAIDTQADTVRALKDGDDVSNRRGGGVMDNSLIKDTPAAGPIDK